MRKYIIILAYVLACLVQGAMAQGSEQGSEKGSEKGSVQEAQRMVGRVARYVGQMGNYDVEFDIEAEGYKASGSYSVAGDAYYIKLQHAEVYSDGKVRYEIDHERREVNVDVVDLSSRNVMDNPTRCFDFVGEEYDVGIQRKSGGEVTLRIVAKDDAFEGEIFLTADVVAGKPQELQYRLYDDVITVKIKSIKPRKTKVATYSKSDYKDYEEIDFR